MFLLKKIIELARPQTRRTFFSKYIVVSEVAFPINPVVSDSLHDF